MCLPKQSGLAPGDILPTHRSEMGQRLSVSPNRQTPRALGAKIIRLFCASWRRRTLRSGRFTEAKKAAQQALQAAEMQGNSTLSNALRDEIALYELGLPYHKKQ